MSQAGTFHLVTYGCQMNKLDSELVASRLVQAGWEAAIDEEQADLILLNTCSVRENAEDRVWGRLGSLKSRKRQKPGLLLGVLGCMAQEHKVFIRSRMPHVDLVCGTRDFGRIDELIAEIHEKRSSIVATGNDGGGDLVHREVQLRPHPSQAFVNIIRGCNMPCTYCIVPATRGEELCRPVADIVDEVLRLVGDGVTEITLLGQTVNAYGHDLRPRASLAMLLRELHQIPALRRISFITSHPNYLTPELMDAMAELPRVSRYFHLPAQSGSDRMLLRMQRKYDVQRYLKRVEELRARVPEIEFASDWIVGFPGETEEDHQASIELMERVRFSQSFVFKYSPRPLTVADDYFEDDVPEEVKARRNQELLAVQERISLEKNQALIGQQLEVMVEGPSKSRADRFTGRTMRNRLVHFDCSDHHLIGRYLSVQIQDAGSFSLSGVLVNESQQVSEFTVPA
ncbi:MAG: tRNA (N6-isopentenyl adenosine(37)-C2)-methylthiotransferase MiaB [Planctomycetota bacterium]|nr:MAG: tRNA (N6-isopentenyl adenosine(37)-C2)-methylthiotransferase MiaB [Planctomycetota bacterium]